MPFPLQWATWRVTTRLHSVMRLSHHPGSRLAGALGRTLRNSHCNHETDDFDLPLCPENQPACGKWPPCLYGELIRTQAIAANQKPRDVPRPLIVSPLDGGREEYRADDLFAFDITLLGQSIARFPALRSAIHQIGHVGVGDDYSFGLGRFEVESMRALTGSRAAPSALGSNAPAPIEWNAVLERAAGLRGKALRVELMSPLRLLDTNTKRENPPALLTDKFDFLAFWLALNRRLKDLAFFHGSGPAQLPFLETGAVKLAGQTLKWWQASRYSGSQKREIDASGLLGTFEIEGEFEPLLPYLVAGEWLHVGKNTDMGDGRFQLSPL